MNRRLFGPSRRRRAAALVFVVIMLPLTLVILTMMMTELQVRKFEIKRNELRVQSRLLAESALALASTLPAPPEKPIHGKIEGAGKYLVDRTRLADGKDVFWVSGIAGPPRYQIITNLYAVAGDGGKMSVLSTSQRAISEKGPNERPLYDGPTTNGPPKWDQIKNESDEMYMMEEK